MSQNIDYLIIGIALLFAILAIAKPSWPCLPVSVILIAIELFSKVSKSVIIVALLGLSVTAIAQTNNPPDTGVPNLLGDSATSSLLQQAYDDTIGTSNGVFVATAARKLVGNANRFSLDYIYSFNQNAALIIGYDDIRSGGYSQANILKGGLNLKANIYPFKNFGNTNFVLQPYGFALAASPTSGTSNNGGIGQLVGGGVSWEHSFTKNLSLELGGFYENSTGEGIYNGNWLGVLGGLHYHF